jgi:hypothetical protein
MASAISSTAVVVDIKKAWMLRSWFDFRRIQNPSPAEAQPIVSTNYEHTRISTAGLLNIASIHKP